VTAETAPGIQERWIQIERRLDAPRERVHRAWSDPDELAAWFPRQVEGSLTVGTRSILTWHDRRIPIDVLASDPPTLFRFRWAWPTGDEYQTTVTVQLEPQGYGTLVRLQDGPFDLTRPGVLDAWAEGLEGWGEALTNQRAPVDHSVDLRQRRR
jgi:uncharacterized protein YndB with AHSA1/START domain